MKRTARAIPTTMLARINTLLSGMEPKKDSVDIKFPVLKALSLISAIERMFTTTTFTYRLTRLSYYLEVCLSRGVLADDQPSCTVCLCSSKWDAVANSSRENFAILDLFPDKQKEGDGMGYFLGHLMDRLAQFDSDALPVLE